MPYLVLAYPNIDGSSYNWIQSLRQEYDDRYYNVVEPHFTIVFPVFDIDEISLIDHIEKICGSVSSIQFTARSTVIVKDPLSEYTDVFLVPDEGNSQIIKLHDKIYTGILSESLRLDIPFIPHIGIAASTDMAEAKKISDKLNQEDICIAGKIEVLDLVSYNHPEIKTVKKFYLP